MDQWFDAGTNEARDRIREGDAPHRHAAAPRCGASPYRPTRRRQPDESF